MQYIGFWLLTLVLVGVSVAYLLYPILAVKRLRYGPEVQPNLYDKRMLQAIEERDKAYSAIGELDQDLVAGNLDEADYHQMRRRYKEQAVAALIVLDQEQSLQNEQAAAIEKVVAVVRVQLEASKVRSSKTGGVVQKDRIETKVVTNERENRITRYCKLCKHEVRSGAIYCTNCGTTLSLPKGPSV